MFRLSFTEGISPHGKDREGGFFRFCNYCESLLSSYIKDTIKFDQKYVLLYHFLLYCFSASQN